jgi:hypothetical protein
MHDPNAIDQIRFTATLAFPWPHLAKPAGQIVGARPPYGYRYLPRHEGAPGRLVIDDAEADLVRLLYG